MAVVTGATSGMGVVVATEIARQGAAVVAVGRDPGRTEAAAERIRSATGNPAVAAAAADLSVLAEVRRLAEELRSRFRSLDVLVHNAGAVFATRQLTMEGHERTWALNVLAPFLLTQLLTDRLLAAPRARIVNVASAAHRFGRIDLADLERAHRYTAFGAYGQSKLALLLLTYEWARRLEGRPVTVNALHPGFVATRFGRNNPGAFGFGMALAEFLFGLSAERGARTTIILATSPGVEGVSGRYFTRSRPHRSSPASYDAELGRRVFAACEAATGLAPRSPV